MKTLCRIKKKIYANQSFILIHLYFILYIFPGCELNHYGENCTFCGFGCEICDITSGCTKCLSGHVFPACGKWIWDRVKDVIFIMFFITPYSIIVIMHWTRKSSPRGGGGVRGILVFGGAGEGGRIPLPISLLDPCISNLEDSITIVFRYSLPCMDPKIGARSRPRSHSVIGEFWFII